MGWYDTVETGTITNRLSSDVSLIQDAVSDKMGAYIQAVSSFLVGIIIAFYFSWKLTLVIMSFMSVSSTIRSSGGRRRRRERERDVTVVHHPF